MVSYPRLATLMVVVLLLGAMAASSARAERRVALVMGNAQYANTVALPNVENDAPAIAAALKRLGFEVIQGTNLTHSAMNDRLKDFSRALVGAEVGLFFYAGHGLQVGGENYLVPVDATLKQEGDLEFEAVKVDSVLKQMFRETKVKIVLLDACRDNPFASQISRSMSPRSRSTGGAASGMSAIDASAVSGTIIAFATAPGSVALDGIGSHSPFTAALLEHMETPGLDVDLMMKRVRGSVVATTGERQQPWTNSSLNGDFSLAPAGAQKTTQPPASQAAVPAEQVPSQTGTSVKAELELWNAAEASGKVSDYQAYLTAYPEGRFALTARHKAEQLQGSRSTSPDSGIAAAAPAGLETAIANAGTEKGLSLSSEEIRDLHTRLVLLGYQQGGIRAAFNKKSRDAIRAWQAAEHLIPSGFFNKEQIDYLKAKSQRLHENWVAQNRPDLVTASEGSDDKSGESRSSESRGGEGHGHRRASAQGGGGGGGNFERAFGHAVGAAVGNAMLRGAGRLPF